jgi:hypothetical protein
VCWLRSQPLHHSDAPAIPGTKSRVHALCYTEKGPCTCTPTSPHAAPCSPLHDGLFAAGPTLRPDTSLAAVVWHICTHRVHQKPCRVLNRHLSQTTHAQPVCCMLQGSQLGDPTDRTHSPLCPFTLYYRACPVLLTLPPPPAAERHTACAGRYAGGCLTAVLLRSTIVSTEWGQHNPTALQHSLRCLFVTTPSTQTC